MGKRRYGGLLSLGPISSVGGSFAFLPSGACLLLEPLVAVAELAAAPNDGSVLEAALKSPRRCPSRLLESC